MAKRPISLPPLPVELGGTGVMTKEVAEDTVSQSCVATAAEVRMCYQAAVYLVNHFGLAKYRVAQEAKQREDFFIYMQKRVGRLTVEDLDALAAVFELAGMDELARIHVDPVLFAQRTQLIESAIKARGLRCRIGGSWGR